MMLFICSACGETYVIDPELAGKQIQCRACHALVPAQAVRPASAPEPETPAAKAPAPPKAGIPFTCPVCGERYEVSEKLAGKKILCRVCGEPARAPSVHGDKE
jgi:transcription elongation factor Elf1